VEPILSSHPKEFGAYSLIGGWFEYALRKGDPVPSEQEQYDLARTLQILLNQTRSRELWQMGGTTADLKDVSPNDWQTWHLEPIGASAAELREHLSAYRTTVGDSHILGPKGPVDIEDLSLILSGLAIHAPATKDHRRGRPRAPWHDVGRAFFLKVQEAMKSAGLKKRLALTNPGSVPVIVATRAISWAYAIRLNELGFVTAMRQRDRRTTQGLSVRKARR
jgi:hypothetical protein